MAVPKWYANGLLNLSNGGVDLDTHTVKFILLTLSYTPAQATHATRTDLGANEASGGSGYPGGGAAPGFTVASLTLSLSTLTLNWDAADISQAITGGPFAFRYGAWYKSTGTAGTDLLIGYVDFGSQSVTDATLNITQTNQLTITAS